MTANRPLRIGLVGCGAFGACHARAWANMDNAVLSAVFDPVEGRAHSVARASGASVVHNLEDLVSVVDAVDVTTPPACHSEIVRYSLLSGRHVLVEKPFGTCAREASELARLAERADKVLMVGYLERFHPMIGYAIASLPDPQRIETVRINRGPPQHSHTGIILDLMCHDVELATRWIAIPVSTVTATARRNIDGLIDEVAAELRFSDGRMASLVASWRGPGRHREILASAHGERRRIDLLAPNPGGDLLGRQLASFVGAICDGSQVHATADDAVRTHAIIRRLVDVMHLREEASCI